MINFILNLISRRKLRGVIFSKIEPLVPQAKKLGLYIHIPFCKTLCPFCPYNRYLWREELGEPYIAAVKKEMNTYREMLPGVQIDSLYVGGGTPTVMVDRLVEILMHARDSFAFNGDICIEANPDDINKHALTKLADIGVTKISIGVQSFNNEVLKAIGRRSHDGETAERAIKLALDEDFRCVNADFMFSLPLETPSRIIGDLKAAIKIGVHQITTYPLLLFPYTKMYQDVKKGRISLPSVKQEERAYHEIVHFLKNNGYEMCTAWSFVKEGVDKYGSVEREEYIGIGAGAMSVTNQFTYVNTHHVAEYIKAVEKGLPIAIGTNYPQKSAAIKWFMIRLYELGFEKQDFAKAFDGLELLEPLLRIFRLLDIVDVNERSIKVTSKGLFPVHQMTKRFLTTYISRICEECLRNPWPDEFKI